MKKTFKGLFALVIALFLTIPFINVNAASKKVKVYIFEAGGCPYCEAQEEYLKGLDSYGKKFEIVKKELYVDHIDWAKGKDYELGVKVATEFQKAGFADASYQGTPFVVISDIYAKAAYNTSLESVIDQAYEEGDKDVVGCYQKNKKNCLAALNKDDSSSDVDVINIVTTVSVGAIVVAVYLYKSEKDKKDILNAVSKKEKAKK